MLLLATACNPATPMQPAPTQAAVITLPAMSPTTTESAPRQATRPDVTAPPAPSVTASLPASLPEVLNANNAAQVSQLAVFGRGTIIGPPVLSPYGVLLAVPGSRGVDLYDPDSLTWLHSLGAPDQPPQALLPVAFFPDSQRLVSGNYEITFTDDGRTGFADQPYTPAHVTIWDTTNGQRLQQLAVPADTYLSSLAVSSTGQRLAAGFGNNTIQLWDVDSGEPVAVLDGTLAEFSPDGLHIVTTPYGIDAEAAVRLYDAEDGRLVEQWPGERAVFAPNSLLAVESAGAVRLVDLETGRVLQAFNGRFPTFSPDSQLLAVNAGGTLTIYRLADGVLLQSLGAGISTVSALAFSPDNRTLAAAVEQCPYPGGCAFDESVSQLWRLADGMLLGQWAREDFAPWPVFLPNEQGLLWANARSLELIDPDDGSPIANLGSYSGELSGLGVSLDSSELVSTQAYGSYPRLWSLASHQTTDTQAVQGDQYGFQDPLFLPDGRSILLGRELWMRSGSPAYPVLAEFLQDKTPASAALSPDGSTLAVGMMEGELILWNLVTDQLAQALDGFTGEVSSLSFAQDGRVLAAAYLYPDYIVQLWSLPAGEPLGSIAGHEWSHELTRVCLSPDGARLAAVAINQDSRDLGTVEVWDTTSGALVYSLAGAGLLDAAYSPSGELIATGGNDRTVRLWRASDGQLLHTLIGHSDFITDLAFTPDGRSLVSAGNDGVVIQWGLPGQ